MSVRLRLGKNGWAALGFYMTISLLWEWPRFLWPWSLPDYNSGDCPIIAWEYWWFRHALLDLHQTPLLTDYQFHPHICNLALQSHVLVKYFCLIPLTVLGGPLLSHSVGDWISYWLCGLGAFLLARRWLNVGAASPWTFWAALLAGLIYGFAPTRYAQMLMHTDIASVEWVPFFLLFFTDALSHGKRSSTLLAGLSVGLLLMTSSLQIAYIMWCGVCALLFFWPGWKRAATVCAAAAAVTVLTSIPVTFGSMQSFLSSSYVLHAWGNSEYFSCDVMHYLLPSMLHPLFGTAVRAYEDTIAIAPFEKNAALGFSVMLLAALACVRTWRSAATRFALLLFSGFFLLSLGPGLSIAGWTPEQHGTWFHWDGRAVAVPMPYFVVHALPVLKHFRFPSRFSMAAMLGIALLAARGLLLLVEPLSKPRQTLTVVAVFALVLFEYVPLPLRLWTPPISSADTFLSRMPQRGAVLGVPLGWATGLDWLGISDNTREPITASTQLFAQTVHHKPIVAGHVARLPLQVFKDYWEEPIIRKLLLLQARDQTLPRSDLLPPYESIKLDVSSAALAKDRATAGDSLRRLDIGYVVVYQPQRWKMSHEYLRMVCPLRLVAAFPDSVVYEVQR